jgi:hypothetical protein
MLGLCGAESGVTCVVWWCSAGEQWVVACPSPAPLYLPHQAKPSTQLRLHTLPDDDKPIELPGVGSRVLALRDPSGAPIKAPDLDFRATVRHTHCTHIQTQTHTHI